MRSVKNSWVVGIPLLLRLCATTLVAAQTPGLGNEADSKEVVAACGSQATLAFPIDMRVSGVEPKARFARDQRVCVVVYNMNPFTTVYRVRVTSASYPQDALADLPKALGITVPRAPATTTGSISMGEINTLFPIGPGAPTEAAGKKKALSEACTKLESFRRQVEFVTIQKQSLDDDLDAARKALTTVGQAADSLYQSGVRAAALIELAKAFIASFPDPTKEPLVGGFAGRATALTTTSTALLVAAAQSPRDGSCPDLEVSLGQLSTTLSTDLPATARLAAATDEAITDAGMLRKLAVQLIRDPKALRHTFWLGDFDNPTYVDVVVRTAPRPPADVKDTLWRTDRSPRLYFGDRRRFSVLGGLSFGVDRVPQSFQVVRTSGDPDNRRIALKEETVPIAPMLYASAALWRWPKLSLNVIGGVGPTFTESIKAVVFFGGGVGLADDRVHLMVGGLSAPRTSLTGGYSQDDVLPATQESVPVKTDRKLKVALGVAVRPF